MNWRVVYSPRRRRLIHVWDPAIVKTLATERFATGLMSDTKWRKLFRSLTPHLQDVQMIVKFIDVDEPKLMRFPPNLDCHHAYMDSYEFDLCELRSIEWLELPADLGFLLRSVGQFALQPVPGGTRVIGYAGEYPD